VPGLARAAVATGEVDVLFFEVHPDPDHAPSDGPNMVVLHKFPAILDGLIAVHRALRGAHCGHPENSSGSRRKTASSRDKSRTPFASMQLPMYTTELRRWRDKGKPAERLGRKATGPDQHRAAELPNVVSSEGQTEHVAPRDTSSPD